MAADLQTACGRITQVQEDRFVLVTESGEAILCTPAHDARLDGRDLRRLHKDDVLVTVTYSGQPGLASCVAHRVEPADARDA